MKTSLIKVVLGYVFVTIVILFVLSFIASFINPKESFDDCKPTPGTQADVPTLNKPKRLINDPSPLIQRPYITWEQDAGDFEGDFDRTMINRFEGGIEATKDAINLSLVQFPFDWANAPPASAIFQEQNSLFLDKDNLVRNASTYSAKPYMTPTDIMNDQILPKVENFADAEQVLKTYKPMSSDKLGKYSEKDAMTFINEYYAAQGLVPEVVNKDGVYEVVSVMEKDPKIVYEDELNPPRDTWKPLSEQGDFAVQSRFVGERNMGLDPMPSTAYNPVPSADSTLPMLERIFGPGLQYQQWG